MSFNSPVSSTPHSPYRPSASAFKPITPPPSPMRKRNADGERLQAVSGRTVLFPQDVASLPPPPSLRVKRIHAEFNFEPVTEVVTLLLTHPISQEATIPQPLSSRRIIKSLDRTK